MLFGLRHEGDDAQSKAHADRVALMESIKRATLHQNMRIERDVLLGASLHGALRAESHNRLEALNELLKGSESHIRLQALNELLK